MIATLKHNKTLAISAAIFAAAFVICGIAWARFFYVAASNPSPVRYMAFVSAAGPLDPFRQTCAGPAFFEADTAWRFCQYETKAASARPVATLERWGMVRFDLEAGRAELLWPLPEDRSAQVLAVAQARDGALAMAWGAPDLSAVYWVRPEGGTESLGLPPGALASVSGLAWAGESIEIVTHDEEQVVIAPYTAGTGWGEVREAAPPDACADEGTLCAYQFAHLGADGWRFLYALAPVEPGGAGAMVDFVLAGESGAATPVDSVPLADLAPGQVARDDAGRLVGLRNLFDQAPGNVVNWSLEAAPFVLHGGTWERVAAPAQEASFYFSEYELSPDGLRWIPGLRYPQRGWQIDRWLTLKSSGEGVALASFEGESGPVLTHDTSFLRQGATQTVLLPASDGGYWMLGPNGAYLKASGSMTRADRLSLVERIERVFDNFGELKIYNDNFYREQELLKMAAFPLVLLSLPAAYLLVFFVAQVRRNTRAWIILLAQVSGVYLILATIFMWWFWETMRLF